MNRPSRMASSPSLSVLFAEHEQLGADLQSRLAGGQGVHFEAHAVFFEKEPDHAALADESGNIGHRQDRVRAKLSHNRFHVPGFRGAEKQNMTLSRLSHAVGVDHMHGMILDLAAGERAFQVTVKGAVAQDAYAERVGRATK